MSKQQRRREPQPKPGLSMRHAGKPGGVVTLRQETGASTGGLAAFDLRAESIETRRLGAIALSGATGEPAVALRASRQEADVLRGDQRVGTKALGTGADVVAPEGIVAVVHRVGADAATTFGAGLALHLDSSLVAAHHKRRNRIIAQEANHA